MKYSIEELFNEQELIDINIFINSQYRNDDLVKVYEQKLKNCEELNNQLVRDEILDEKIETIKSILKNEYEKESQYEEVKEEPEYIKYLILI